ncbi:MAG TPA: hypothetical protein VFT22_01765 [Kofleriaceae bacterium]|nr:hypothetical protein [Kofleriaceae bacterium]
MKGSTDMSSPVTREELVEEIAPLATRAEIAPLATRVELEEAVAKLATKPELEEAVAKLATKAELEEAVAKLATKAELEEAVAKLATKVELEIWGGALLARIESSERRLSDRIVVQMTEQTKRLEQRLHTELAQHANALYESLSALVTVIDDKYADVPARVTRLEARVFARRRR